MTYTIKYVGTVDFVYTKTGLTSSQVDLTSNDYQLIAEAEAELEMLCGRKFTTGNSVTEYFSIRDNDITGKYQTSVQLRHYPVQSISAFNTYDTDGTAIDTYDTLTSAEIAAGTYISDDYWLEVSEDPLSNTSIPNGKIVLIEDSLPKGTNNVKVTYTYGYSSVPTSVKNLAVCLASIRMWVTFLGGQYNRVNSYTMPETSKNKGDFYQRGKQNIEMLREEADRLLDRIGRRPRTLFMGTGDPR